LMFFNCPNNGLLFSGAQTLVQRIDAKVAAARLLMRREGSLVLRKLYAVFA
jgi:hypothetical protein